MYDVRGYIQCGGEKGFLATRHLGENILQPRTKGTARATSHAKVGEERNRKMFEAPTVQSLFNFDPNPPDYYKKHCGPVS